MKRRKPRIGKPPRLRLVGQKGTKDAPSTAAEVQYFKELHAIIDKVFSVAADEFEWTWSQLAIHAGLAWETVARLGDRETKWPRFSTVWRLCKAVGWDLQPIEQPKNKRQVLELRKIA